MGVVRDIAEFSLFAFGAAMLLLQFAALVAGNWIGRRRARRMAGDSAESVGIVIGGLLGLLAFTLSISIGIADKRFDDRRRAALDEANAIGTAWLRAEAIGHPRGTEIARLLKDYTETRLAWLQAPRRSPLLQASLDETSRLQAQMWAHATAIARERPDAIAAALMASLNETFDLATTQRWAFRGQAPPELPWLLFSLTLLGVGGIGFQWGLKHRWHPVLALLLLSSWSLCMMLIVDLSNPRVGEVRVDLSPYRWTLESIAAGAPAP